ncbi:hypothetical protein REPUB_Repub13aG0081700 [Reevesia pubescens]
MAELLFETYGVPSIAFGVDAVFSYKYNQQHGICEKNGLAICLGFTTTHVILFVDGEPVYKGCCQTNIGGYHKGGKKAEDRTRCWQLSWVPPPTEEPPSEEEMARKAAIRERQGQRLREMAEARRSSRINELKNQLHGLEFLLHQLGQIQEEEIWSFLSKNCYVSKEDIESTLLKVSHSRKRRGSFFLQTMTEGQQRAKQKRFEEELEREKKNLQDEERRLENPELYLEQMRNKYEELYEKVEQRKRLKTNGSHTNGNGLTGGVGCGERLNAAQRERMRLLTTAAFDRGKCEDIFGAKDEDWKLYKLMNKDNDDDDDGPEDKAELAHVCSRLQEIDPTFVPKPESTPSQPATAEAPRIRPLTKEDFQIVLGVERFRCPKILFHPNLVGIDQAGLDEMTGVSKRRLPSKDEELENRLTSSIFMIGGCSLSWYK